MTQTDKPRRSRFRHPTTNIRYTAQLFYETQMDMLAEKKTMEPLYSLHYDIPGLINFRREYINDMDPSGLKTAMRLLEDYDHFLMLMKRPWFREAKEQWDKELSAKLEAEATDFLRSVLKDSEAKTTERISAAKTLLGKAKTISKDPQKVRGRPSKEEVTAAIKEEARLSKEEAEDLARIKAVK